MGTELRKLLENAKGTAEHIIAIVLDIRGFTPFCLDNESWDVASYLKRIYIRIIDEYLPKASFYKPTGDGLLVVIPYNTESLRDTVVGTMKNCLNLLQNFGRLCKGDEMINFSTPENVGIGMSRGTACCITSNGTIVDYSGRVINLASRLNDFARPSGIVFDSKLGLSLLPKDVQELFLCENVYVRGIAEDKPIAICFTKQYAIIPPSCKQPLKVPKWLVESCQDSYKKLKELQASGLVSYAIALSSKPLDEKQITLEITYKIGEDCRMVLLDTTCEGVHYVSKGIKHYLDIEFSVLVEELNEAGIKDDTIVKFEVSCPIAQENA